MTRRTRDRLRHLIDQAKRRQIQRAHGKATEAELRMWREADRAEKEQAA